MGHAQHTDAADGLTRGAGLGWRPCLAKGCGRRYRARQWNQHYCQEPDCLRAVRRWQAMKRQRDRRAEPEGRRKHAEAERERRRHAAKPQPDETTPPDGAWSRSKKFFPHRLCARPGCYEPPCDSNGASSSYCCEACRKAVRRVKDRERKWLSRKTKAGRRKRRLEYQALAKKRLPLPPAAKYDPATCGSKLRDVNPGIAVGDSGQAGRLPVSSSRFQGDADHDSQANTGSRPRAPPADGRVVVD
jgi:hypothetical protein